MRRIVPFVLVACAVGCRHPDPENDRLPIAGEAIIFSATAGPDYRRVWLDVKPIDMPPEKGLVDPVLGTRVRIVSDEEPDGGKVKGNRKVIVHVEEGEFAGITGTIDRHDLRPVAR